jgi:hypothetical protein
MSDNALPSSDQFYQAKIASIGTYAEDGGGFRLSFEPIKELDDSPLRGLVPYMRFPYDRMAELMKVLGLPGGIQTLVGKEAGIKFFKGRSLVGWVRDLRSQNIFEGPPDANQR